MTYHGKPYNTKTCKHSGEFVCYPGMDKLPVIYVCALCISFHLPFNPETYPFDVTILVGPNPKHTKMLPPLQWEGRVMRREK